MKTGENNRKSLEKPLKTIDNYRKQFKHQLKQTIENQPLIENRLRIVEQKTITNH